MQLLHVSILHVSLFITRAMPSETIAQRTPISTRSLLILFLRAVFPVSQKPLVGGGILDALP